LGIRDIRAPRDAAAVPAPLAVGYFQAIVGLGAVFPARDMDKLVGVEALEVSEQVHLTGLGHQAGGDVGHEGRSFKMEHTMERFVPWLM